MSKVKPGFRKSGFTVSRNPEITGTPTYNQVIDIINETVDKNAEFYEIEPAIVTKVYAEEKDLPLITNKDGNLVPNWKLLGTVEVELMEQGVSNNTNIKPLSQHIYQLPVIGEVINITEHDGELYYSFPLNTNNNVNENNNITTNNNENKKKKKIDKSKLFGSDYNKELSEEQKKFRERFL